MTKKYECPLDKCPLKKFAIHGAELSCRAWHENRIKSKQPEIINIEDIDNFSDTLKAFLFSKCAESGKAVHELKPYDICSCAEIPFQ